jgi:hypothetical protein
MGTNEIVLGVMNYNSNDRIRSLVGTNLDKLNRNKLDRRCLSEASIRGNPAACHTRCSLAGY